MIALSIRMPALTAAWLLTGEKRYGERAREHVRAWFITPATRMNPNLEYAQGVKGISTGRSYGIIDTVHLVEVARAASVLAAPMLSSEDQAALKDWFKSYLQWMKTSDKGRQERAALNNHATCWALQAAEFARLIGDGETQRELRQLYMDVLLRDQMGHDGSFPNELARAKPFFPYFEGKSRWPYPKDVEHFEELPVRSPGLLFAGLNCGQEKFLDLWKTMNADPVDSEIIRNYPVRQPLLWV